MKGAAIRSSGTPPIAVGPRALGVIGGPTTDDGQAGRPSYLIMDVYGACIRPLGGWFPVSRLIMLMRELGVDDQAVRSAVSRITKRGLLEPQARAGVRGYRLAAAAMQLLDDADRRILAAPSRGTLGDGWVLVAFSVPEEDRDKRYLLRSRLSWLGFGMYANGLWLAPASLTDELEDSIRRMGFEQYVTVFRAQHRGFGDPRTLVERCWDLPRLRRQYTDFLDRWQPVQQKWRRAGRADGVEAFVDYTMLLNQWRKFPYLDPGLPLEILPPDWEGERAAEVFFDLRERLAHAAKSHVAGIAAPP